MSIIKSWNSAGAVGSEWAAGAPALSDKHHRGWRYIVVNEPPLRLQTTPKGPFPVSDRH